MSIKPDARLEDSSLVMDLVVLVVDLSWKGEDVEVGTGYCSQDAQNSS